MSSFVDKRAMISLFLCFLVIVIHKIGAHASSLCLWLYICINPNIVLCYPKVVEISHNIVVFVSTCLTVVLLSLFVFQ